MSGVSQLKGVASGVDVAILKQNQTFLMALIERMLLRSQDVDKSGAEEEEEEEEEEEKVGSAKPCLHL